MGSQTCDGEGNGSGRGRRIDLVQTVEVLRRSGGGLEIGEDLTWSQNKMMGEDYDWCGSQ